MIIHIRKSPRMGLVCHIYCQPEKLFDMAVTKTTTSVNKATCHRCGVLKHDDLVLSGNHEKAKEARIRFRLL